jgi:hypothetical protein
MANLTVEPKEEFNKVLVNDELLENGFLYYLNEGLLYRSGMRLEFDRRNDGTVQLHLLVRPAGYPKFAYTDDAAMKLQSAWSSIQAQLVP